MIRDDGGWKKFIMIELEKHPCNDKREAAKRENEVMKDLRANMNMRNGFTTVKEKQKYKNEYKQKNQEKIKIQNKQYRLENRDEIKNRNKNIVWIIKKE